MRGERTDAAINGDRSGKQHAQTASRFQSLSFRPAQMHRTPPRRKRRPSPLLPPRLLAVAVAFASTLIFLLLVLLSTSPPSPPPSIRLARGSRRASSSTVARCTATASLGELGDAMVSMLPKDLPFTVFIPSPASLRRVLRLQHGPKNASAAAEDGHDDDNTYAVLSRVLGFSAVPRRLLAADVPPREAGGAARLLDSVSGLRIHASRDERGLLVVNGVRSECVDVVRGETVVHVIAGVLMDAEFERSFAVKSGT